MTLVPSWAPNVHPLVIHFPIVLVTAAAVMDLLDAVFERPAWLGPAAAGFYVAAAVASLVAYLTGAQAASTVFIPGMAHPDVESHRAWAMAAGWWVGAAALLRVAALRAGYPRTRAQRIGLLASGLLAAFLVQQTAERGARLVYVHGVGVIAAPSSR
jgi:uncharacterized membrane protein